MRFILIGLVCVLACELAAARLHSNSLAWRQFKQQHGKVYASQEDEARRFGIFLANKQLVERHNANASATFTMGLNHMADWTPEEYARVNGFRLGERPLEVTSDEELDEILASAGDDPLPEEFDWRQVEGHVSGIKNQGQCGSCWAFATIGVLEGQELAHKMKSLVPLSEQEILDCSESNNGCEGGLMSEALDDLAKNIGGAQSESDYPYFGDDQECFKNASKFLPLRVKGHKMLPPRDEQVLRKVLVKYGPVAVAFEATGALKTYERGVFVDQVCRAGQPNHAVLVVGYGKDTAAGDFWIVKNSWGTKWGEQGFFRIQRGENMCGIADLGTIATFK